MSLTVLPSLLLRFSALNGSSQATECYFTMATLEVVKYNKSDYIETVSLEAPGQGVVSSIVCLMPPGVQQSGNKVSKKSVLCGSQNIVLLGKVSRLVCNVTPLLRSSAMVV